MTAKHGEARQGWSGGGRGPARVAVQRRGMRRLGTAAAGGKEARHGEAGLALASGWQSGRHSGRALVLIVLGNVAGWLGIA